MPTNKNWLELFEEAKKGNKKVITELKILVNSTPPNREALTTLASCYYSGYAVYQNYKRAYSLYKKAANLGCDIAMCSLGLMFQYGHAVEINLQTAAYWYYKSSLAVSSKTAVNQSFYLLEELAKKMPPHPTVLTNLGVCYESGYGTPQNYIKAMEMYSQAAQQGYDLGMYNLGLAYQYGRGVIKDLSIAMYWFSESIKCIIDTNRNVNLSKKHLDELTNLIQNNKTISSRYDSQVIVDFRNNGSFFSSTALTRCKKWNSNNNKLSHLMRGEDLLKKNNQFDTSINSKKLRMYIAGHCWVASDYLYFEGEKEKVHFNELTDALAYYVGNQSVVISLMACCAARGFKENSKDSFAAKLHLALVNRLKRDVPVIARTSLTSIWLDTNQQTTFKLCELEKYKENYDSVLSLAIIQDTSNRQVYEHHQEDSKVIFMMENNKQIKIDAYKGIQILKEKWRSNILETLNEVNKITLEQDIRELVQDWIAKFDTKSTDEIYRIVKEEMDNKASPIKNHSSEVLKFFTKFFKIRTDTQEQFQKLIESAASIFDYSQAIDPMPQDNIQNEKLTLV